MGPTMAGDCCRCHDGRCHDEDMQKSGMAAERQRRAGALRCAQENRSLAVIQSFVGWKVRTCGYVRAHGPVAPRIFWNRIFGSAPRLHSINPLFLLPLTDLTLLPIARYSRNPLFLMAWD